ncbi:MAG: SCO family protein [Woeseiaceae bacterium]|nr:SCO family protein [Woeseiaceae bacterium]
MPATRHLIAACLVLAGLAGGVYFIGSAVQAPAAVPQTALVFPEPRPLPAFRLTGDDGEPFTRASLQGGWHLLFFGFTHCPDVCPATLQQLAVVRRRLAADTDGPLPGIVLISVDPERDTPAVLADYVANFGDAVRGVTGDPAAIEALAADLGIHFEKAPAADGDYTMNHSAAVLVTNPRGELHALFSTPHDIGAFANDLPIIMAER